MNSTHGMHTLSLCKNTSFLKSTANVIGKILMQLWSTRMQIHFLLPTTLSITDVPGSNF